MSARDQQDWHYASRDGQRLGPVSIQELSALATRGEVGPTTLVWSYGYSDWIPAEQISDLLAAAREATPIAVPPPVPAATPVAGEEKEAIATPVTVSPVTAAAPEEPASPAAPALDLKPRKGSFICLRIVFGLIGWAVLGAITAAILAATENPPWPGAVVFVAGSILAVFASLVAYRKERYQILDSRVLCHSGGMVSDQTTELEIRNITHVKLVLPWLRYKFYGVGNVIVETAGNARPVVLRAIPEPEAVYEVLQERMKKHGYDLTRQQLLLEERPAMIGIIGECLGLAGGAVGLAIVGTPFIMGMSEAAQSPVFDLAAKVVIALVIIMLIAGVIVRFLDLQRRKYRVYNDVVVYEEGFLTRHNAFIPYENIADANTKSSFLDRLFGLYDVQVSCQGSGSDIKFRRLNNGIALSGAIDHLVVLARQKEKPAAKNAALGSQIRPRRAEPEAIPVGEAMVAELRMHAGRTLVPLLLIFPILPLWIVSMIQASIRLMSTQYSVRPGSVRHSYRFMTLHDREFAYDKITGVVVAQNLWDRMFGTLTLKFWSIGSGEPMVFAHVAANQIDMVALMRQAGIPAGTAEHYQAAASFGVFTWLRARLKFLPLLLLFAGGVIYAAIDIDPVLYYALLLPVLIIGIAVICAKLRYSRQRLVFHDHHIEAEQGIIAKRWYYVRYGNVKRTKVTRYPGVETGDLEIFVAGEEEIQQTGVQKKQGQRGLMKQCSFTSGFLPAVRDQGTLLDDILCGRVDPSPQAVAAEPLEVLLEARRSVGNAVFRLVLFSILLVVPIVLLPITIPLKVISARRWRYRIEAARIVLTSGVLYRSETSILLDRVDSLQQSQGPLNKIFKNGNVTIMTAGSSKPDLHIIDSPEYLPMYEVIRERSQ
ncbi:PH domain-containing protein [Luteolibacter arcticus]|uniref:PH domain-containing protein n=1 Tax=Luteolibacter arcticus TaxID=1581411 RepID=A0ABT3GE17_9BACT|nr:PH domain-containing protein [Luteolibacter arcticus]MCW1921865.1 PH domain-containing protein [Luteolibacter arcticus]